MDGNSFNSAPRVALLCGGDSAERVVSLASGRQVALAMSLAGYLPVLIDPFEIELDAIDWPTFDACFVALHGGDGENGTIQSQLEQFGVPYTGSNPEASRLAMSKSAAKRRFEQCGVPTLPFVGIDASDVLRSLATLEFPLIIKPDGQGSSLGVSVARTPDDLPRCIAVAAQFDSRLIAEPFIAGREFTASLLGRDPLPLIEIVAPGPLFTYDAKYASPATEYRFDSQLPAAVAAQIYRAAVAAALALETAGLVRVDIVLDDQNRPWVLELNTIPGLTARSLSPRSARAAGIDMRSLADWMVRDALSRSASCHIPVPFMGSKTERESNARAEQETHDRWPSTIAMGTFA